MTENQTLEQTDVRIFDADPAHSRLGFVVRHMGFSKVRGSFEEFEASIRMNDDDLSTLSATAEAKAASVDTNEEKRDNHLRSEDFFDVENYPTLSFESTSVKDISGDSFTLVGDLTIHGVTKQIEFAAVHLGTGPDPWGGTRIAFEAETTINRKDFGLNWNAALETGGVLVSENVRIVLEIQAVERSEDDE
jgi:polyisoprenoid-binding protein YceI